jgi:hypothetical protein
MRKKKTGESFNKPFLVLRRAIILIRSRKGRFGFCCFLFLVMVPMVRRFVQKFRRATYLPRLVFPNDQLNHIIGKAQIPPLHSPWRLEAAAESMQLLANLEVKVEQELQISGEDKHSKPNRLYVIQNGTLWALRDQEAVLRSDEKGYIGRWRPFEEMVQFGLDLARQLVDDGKVGLHPRLQELTQHSSLIPLIVDAKDFSGCSPGTNFPLFTYAMMTFSSEHSFDHNENCVPIAVPGYDMWTRLCHKHRFLPEQWGADGAYKNRPFWQRGWFARWKMRNLQENEDVYPWSLKQPKIVWRGSTTGDDARLPNNKGWQAMLRSQLVSIGKNHATTMDFAFHKLNQGWDKSPFAEQINGELGPISGRMPFPDFMNYKAVLDIEGNSWSNRSGRLFCLNSVVVKVRSSFFATRFVSILLMYVPLWR